MNFLPLGSEVVFIAQSNIPYTYPDRDFCIFAAHYPLNRSLKLGIYNSESNASLTFAWLCKFAGMKNYPCGKRNVTSEEFDTRLKLCKLNPNETDDYTSLPEYYQTRLMDVMSIEIVPFVLIPCACLIGLFFNWKIIQTIKSKRNVMSE
jgi:hypothetical protein